MSFAAPVGDMGFLLQVAGFADSAGVDEDMVASLFEEAGKFAADVLAPLNRQGDIAGVTFDQGKVTMPDGWRATYEAWAAAGWNGAGAPEQWGGMNLPVSVSAPLMEIWTSACMSFALGPNINQGTVELMMGYADQALQDLYLPKIVSGEWSTTMSLTEPQAGSDLANARTKADPAPDGTYRLFGQKIFITYGDHDLTDNIIHFVLARLPDAPPGTKGLSLFLVPKILIGPTGELGARNDLRCVGIEHKMGIHAGPTCTMAYGDEGGAVGWLLGKPHQGLACMFTLMNHARLGTGLQGVALGERATQQAYEFARTRRQGRSLGEAAGVQSLIIEHPDVRRMLLSMRSATLASRAIGYAAAVAIDHAHAEQETENREVWQARASLLTPIVKMYCSELGFETASIGVQVHGGMGYVEETGAAQYLRDSRVIMIYEGTNSIQAIDLVMRKVLRDGATAAKLLIAEMEDIANNAQDHDTAAQLSTAVSALKSATSWLLETKDEARLLGGATPYLRLFGVTLAGALMIKGASMLGTAQFPQPADFPLAARWFAETRLSCASALAAMVRMQGAILADDQAMTAYAR